MKRAYQLWLTDCIEMWNYGPDSQNFLNKLELEVYLCVHHALFLPLICLSSNTFLYLEFCCGTCLTFTTDEGSKVRHLFACLSLCVCPEAVWYIKAREDGQHLETVITMESSCFANSYSSSCFFRAAFILKAHAVFSHLSKPIQTLRNISHLYGLVKSLVPQGMTNKRTQTRWSEVESTKPFPTEPPLTPSWTFHCLNVDNKLTNWSGWLVLHLKNSCLYVAGCSRQYTQCSLNRNVFTVPLLQMRSDWTNTHTSTHTPE